MTTLIATCLLMLAPPTAAPADEAGAEEVTLSGRVVELTAALKARGLTFDAGPIARQVVLQDKDNTLVPLLSNDASRALFEDERLRDRPAQLFVKRQSSVPYVQVLSFKIAFEGKLRTPEYYCEICTISVRYPQSCSCCQGPMVLRMKPEAP